MKEGWNVNEAGEMCIKKKGNVVVQGRHEGWAMGAGLERGR